MFGVTIFCFGLEAKRVVTKRKPTSSGKFIGYVSTCRGRATARTQRRHLFKYPIWNLYVEKTDNNHPQLDLAKADLRRGDTFVVYEWAVIPGVVAMRALANYLHEIGAHFVSIKERCDLSDSQRTGLLVQVFEQQRLIKGLTIKLGQENGFQERGTWPGRPRKLTKEVLRRAEELIDAGESVTVAAQKLAVSRRSLHRAGLGHKKNRPPRRTA